MKNLYTKITFVLISLIFTYQVNAQVFDYVNTGLVSPVSFTIDNGTMYIGSVGLQKIQTVDMSDPNLVPQDFINNISFPAGFIVIGDELYFTNGFSNVSKVDLNAPTPAVTNVLTGLDNAFGTALKNNYIYVGLRNTGEIIRFDHTLGINPPIETIATGLGSFINHIVINNDFLYIARGGDSKVSRIDLSQASFPIEDVVTIPEEDGTVIGLGINNGKLYYCSNYLKSVDLSNLNNLPVTYFSGVSSAFWNILFDNNEMYLSQQTADRIVRFEDNYIDPTTSPDYNALINFYNSTNGANWDNNVNWLDTTQSLFSWHGLAIENNRVVGLNLSNNNLDGTLPTALTNLNDIEQIQLPDNELSGNVPDFSNLSALNRLNIGNNNYLFGDIEPNFSSNQNINEFFYTPQSKISDDITEMVILGQNLTLDATTTGSNNIYQWFFDNSPIPNETNPTLSLNNLQQSQLGEYKCQVSNSLVTSLILETGITNVILDQSNPDFVLAPNGDTCLCPNADFGDVGSVQTNDGLKIFTKRSRTQLDAIIAANVQDPQIALTCTSGVTDMSNLFKDKMEFNQNLEHWDVSNVTNMESMFENASTFNNITLSEEDEDLILEFNTSNLLISNWDVSNVTNMDFMFKDASAFNQDISSWCVEQILSEPAEFSLNSALQNNFKPNWGVTCTLSVLENNLTEIIVYPNPTRSKIFLDNLGGLEIEQVSLYNSLGQWVKVEKSTNQGKTIIDLSGLPNGVYFLNIINNDAQQFTQRVIKK